MYRDLVQPAAAQLEAAQKRDAPYKEQDSLRTAVTEATTRWATAITEVAREREIKSRISLEQAREREVKSRAPKTRFGQTIRSDAKEGPTIARFCPPASSVYRSLITGATSSADKGVSAPAGSSQACSTDISRLLERFRASAAATAATLPKEGRRPGKEPVFGRQGPASAEATSSADKEVRSPIGSRFNQAGKATTATASTLPKHVRQHVLQRARQARASAEAATSTSDRPTVTREADRPVTTTTA